jgi:tetratricopeptide repeat protein 21B
LDFLKTNDTVNVGALLALIHAHKKFSSVDRETLIDLDAKLKESRKQADEKGLYFGGYFWYLIGRPDKAREYVDRGVKMNDSCVECLSLKGWIEISNDVKLAYQYFEKALRYILN